MTLNPIPNDHRELIQSIQEQPNYSRSSRLRSRFLNTIFEGIIRAAYDVALNMLRALVLYITFDIFGYIILNFQKERNALRR